MELELIKNSILDIRGKRVILDYELAKLYEVETKALKQAVRRNIDRFPEDFMFQLTKEEWELLRSQSVTLEVGKGQHPKYLPFAFTEQGVAMLSAVLNSQRAIHASIQIMRAFVLMRQWALNYQELQEKLSDLEKRFGQKFTDIEQVLNYLIQKDQKQVQQGSRKKIGFRVYKKVKNNLLLHEFEFSNKLESNRTMMKKIEITVEKTATGYSAFTDEMNVYTTASDISTLYSSLIEALNFSLEEKGLQVTTQDIKLKFDLPQFFQYYKVLNANFLAKRIGMNPALLSQYVRGKKKPSIKQTEKIIVGIQRIGQELADIRLV